MSKLIGPPQSGRVGNVVYINSKRYGQLVRAFVPPRNRRTPAQQTNRQGFGALAGQWRGLPPDNQSAWQIAADRDRTGLSGYHYYMKLNAASIHIGQPRMELPPSGLPSFPINPVGQVVVQGSGKNLSVKLPVSGPIAPNTLVEAVVRVSTGVRFVENYRYAGLLPAPVNGLSDITDLLIARFGLLTPGQAIFLRTRQQIDGWLDVGKITRAIIPLG